MSGFKSGGYTGDGEGVKVHPAEYHFARWENARRWKASHPEALVYYWDGEDWAEAL